MALPITDLVAGIFKPAVELVDEVYTNPEEKILAKAKLIEAEAMAVTKAIDYERGVLEAQSKVIIAEATSDGVLARNWRPVTMLFFLFILGSYWFGILEPSERLSEQIIMKIFDLLTVGLGGYVAARSAEKIVKAVKK